MYGFPWGVILVFFFMRRNFLLTFPDLWKSSEKRSPAAFSRKGKFNVDEAWEENPLSEPRSHTAIENMEDISNIRAHKTYSKRVIDIFFCAKSTTPRNIKLNLKMYMRKTAIIRKSDYRVPTICFEEYSSIPIWYYWHLDINIIIHIR